MHVINLKVNNDGTLDTKTILPLHLGTQGDKACVKLKLEIGDTVEGYYQYIKFYNPQRTVIQRVERKEIVLSINVSSLAGKWLMSFISSDKPITYSSADGDYIFSTVPVEVEVSDGLLDINVNDENLRKIAELEARVSNMEQLEKSLFAISGDRLTIPDYIEEIGSYFLYNSNHNYNYITVGKGVKRIGSYSFYGVYVSNFIFDGGSELETLADYAFSHMNGNDITFPATLSDYGHYAFNGSTLTSIRFEPGSKIRTLNANSFNGVTVDNVALPDGLTKIASNGYVFRNCHITNLKIPATLTSAVAVNSFYAGCDIYYVDLDKGFNVSINLSNCPNLATASIVAMFNALKDRTGMAALSITLGSANLAKVTDADIQVATNKNWTVS